MPRTYFTKTQLVQANFDALCHKRPMHASHALLTALPEDCIYPVAFHMLTGTEHSPAIRCEVVLDETGRTITVDVDPQGFNSLPRA